MARPTEILVPTDFSEASKEAILYGAMLAEAFDATLHLLHVIPDPVAMGWAIDAAYVSQLLQQTERAARDQLDSQLTADERKRCRMRSVVETGAPQARIIDYAKQHGVDLIVMGTHGRGALEKMWVGSVTQSVLQRAPCPVVSVQHPH